MHVLLVAFGFPPSRASGVYRAIAFTRNLVALGHRVTVLTADEEYFALATGTDEELGDTLPPGLAVVRVPYADLRDPVINRWTRRRAAKPRNWREEAEAERDAIFPERYGAWRDRVVAAGMRLQRSDPVDVAIATGNPYVSFAVLAALEATAGVPFVMDDRDSFLYSVYTGEPQPDFDRRAAWWRPVADRAREVWFVNPPIAELYRQAFEEVAPRIRIVENGYDPQYFDPASRPPRDPALPPVFGYIGTLNTGFPLEGLLVGWKRARGHELPGDARLVFIGGLGYREQSPAQRELLRDAEQHGIELRGPTPKTRITDAYAECDVLVFAREGGGLVTSGKIYEYVASGLPIAGVVPAEHDSRRVLAGYPRDHLVAPDTGSWATSLASALADAHTDDQHRWRDAMAFGRQYRRDEIMRAALARALAPRHPVG